MSTIAVDNIKPSAGGTSFTTRGVAKAWVEIDGTGTAAIEASNNVSSITDNGTGDYTVSFTNSMSSATAFCTIQGQGENGSSPSACTMEALPSRLAGSIRLYCRNLANTNVDQQAMSAVMGDLA